jgi:hypothetical protein
VLLDDNSSYLGTRVCDTAYEAMLLLLQKAAKEPPLLEE